MASATADLGNAETAYPITVDAGVATEFVGSLRADQQSPTEEVAGIRMDVATQFEWLDAIEAALRELLCRRVGDASLAEAAAVAAQLRAALASPGVPTKTTVALWLCLYGYISLPFLKHFSSAIGDDLGHAVAHKVLEVLASMAHYLNL